MTDVDTNQNSNQINDQHIYSEEELEKLKQKVIERSKHFT